VSRVFATIGLVALLAPISTQNKPAEMPAKAPCYQAVYLGFDSRLKTEVIARLPDIKEPIRGFEILHGRPLIALTHQVITIDRGHAVALPVANEIRGISVTSHGQLLVQTSGGVETLGQTDLTTDRVLTSKVSGRLYDSGNAVLMEARAKNDLVQFVAWGPTGNSFLVSTVQGTFHAASWNDVGLAISSGNSLLVWEAGGKTVSRLIADKGLQQTRDLCLLAPTRVVVALQATVVLVTSEAMTVIVAMPSARCRLENGILYLLDGKTGLIWKVSGIEQLGTKEGNRAHAEELIRKIPKDQGANSQQFMEAARIIGCDETVRKATSVGLMKVGATPKPEK
jgi:hypothetical protein